jgi:hypothetical protein
MILEDNYGQRARECAGEFSIIDGVGKDVEIVVNEKGGKQSKSPMAMHLVDPQFLNDWFNHPCQTEVNNDVIFSITNFMQSGNRISLIDAIYSCYIELNGGDGRYEDKALVVIAKVLEYGAKRYEPNNWRLIPQEEHINHALIHYIAHKLGDLQDEHLEHCMCRLMMAYATEKSKGFDYNKYVA